MTRIRALLLTLAAVAALGACDDTTDLGDHAEPEGVVLVSGETELYTYMLEDGAASTLAVPVGEHDIAIVFLDADGEHLHADADEEEHPELRVTIGNAGVLNWSLQGSASSGIVGFHGTLTGVEAGTTEMEICLLHGGHCDFEVDIPVTVSAAQ